MVDPRMKVFACDQFVLPLPEKHRFPMAKYRLLRERLSLRNDLEITTPPAATDKQLLTTHSPEYLQALKSGTLEKQLIRRLGFPYSPELVERSRRSVGATYAACVAALDEGAAANLAGGTHHAFRDQPEGFCVFNDSVVALRWLLQTGRIESALVLDCDVHQGNGTAALTRDDGRIFTVSLHGEKNFPFRKRPSNLDIGLPDGTGDEAYLEALSEVLRMDLGNPDLVIYLSGADPYEGDRLGRLALSKAGLQARDQKVLRSFAQRGWPVAVTMGGGYAEKVEDIVDIHEQTVLAALELHRSLQPC